MNKKTGAEETLKTTAEIVDAIHAIQVLTENESKNALALKDAMKNVVKASKQAEEVVEASSVSSNALQNALDKVSESIKDNENAVASMKKDIDIFVV
jgi:copper homeostasis protein CutC